MLAPPWGVGAPSSGKSWIRHCSYLQNILVQRKILGGEYDGTGDCISGEDILRDDFRHWNGCDRVVCDSFRHILRQFTIARISTLLTGC